MVDALIRQTNVFRDDAQADEAGERVMDSEDQERYVSLSCLHTYNICLLKKKTDRLCKDAHMCVCVVDEVTCKSDFTFIAIFLCIHIFATNKKQQTISERGITILAKNLAVMRDGVKINIMDTPGYV